jgi:membrane-associated protease RseP (regulator of RpoE activity)
MHRYSLIAALALAPALLWADGPSQVKDAGKAYAIPYRLTDTSHIMVRVKINGKGPFNFIVDTGAPLVYVSVPVAKMLGITAEKKGQTNIGRFEIEGGPAHTDLKVLVDTPFQLEGMNALGAAGVELHGILGYTLLSQYKMEIDLTKDKMTWTKLDFTPPAPEPSGIKGGGLDMLGKLMKFLAKMSGIKGPPQPDLRGFVGVQLIDKDKGVEVRAVLPKSPAAAVDIQPGDRILEVQGKSVMTSADVMALLAKVRAGESMVFRIERATATKEVKLTAGEGL